MAAEPAGGHGGHQGGAGGGYPLWRRKTGGLRLCPELQQCAHELRGREDQEGGFVGRNGTAHSHPDRKI